jgi:hypothetical protein
MSNAFDILLLIARPAAGKSEIIHYLKGLDEGTRLNRFHLHPFEEIDDFPFLWTWFEEDEILTRLGHPRLHSDAEGYFLQVYLWDVLIERLNLEYSKKLRDDPAYHQHKTTILEFSRGLEHGGYARAFQHLGKEITDRLAILYVDVSWEESLRKNRKRFNPERPDSILQHALEDDKLERLYRETDWDAVSAGDPRYLVIQGSKVPYVVMDNADDVTTRGGDELGLRLEASLNKLWAIYQHA